MATARFCNAKSRCRERQRLLALTLGLIWIPDRLQASPTNTGHARLEQAAYVAAHAAVEEVVGQIRADTGTKRLTCGTHHRRTHSGHASLRTRALVAARAAVGPVGGQSPADTGTKRLTCGTRTHSRHTIRGTRALDAARAAVGPVGGQSPADTGAIRLTCGTPRHAANVGGTAATTRLRGGACATVKRTAAAIRNHAAIHPESGARSWCAGAAACRQDPVGGRGGAQLANAGAVAADAHALVVLRGQAKASAKAVRATVIERIGADLRGRGKHARKGAGDDADHPSHHLTTRAIAGQDLGDFVETRIHCRPLSRKK